MKRMGIIACLTAGVVIMLASCSTRQITREEVVAFIGDFERKAAVLTWQINLERWQKATRGYSDSLAYFEEQYNRLVGNPDNVKRILKYRGRVGDNAGERKLELIFRNCLRPVIAGDPGIIAAIDEVTGIYRDYRPVFEGREYTQTELAAMAHSEKDPARRGSIYAALIKGDENVANAIAKVVRLRNQAVSRLGYNSYYDLMLQADGIEKAELTEILDELDRLSARPYARALDSLKALPGAGNPTAADIEYILHQPLAETAVYYPADGQMALLEATVGGLGFRLRALPIYFMGRVNGSDRPEKSVLAIHVPDDIRVPTEIADGPASFRRLLDQAGRAIYAANIEAGDFLFTRPPAPCFERGMGEIISGLMDSDGWKRKYAGMPEPLVVRSIVADNFRRLYELRHMLLYIAFEQRLYADPYGDPVKTYAELYERYLMLPSVEGARPWATHADYVLEPATMQNLLLGKCMAAQTYGYLKDRYGPVLDNQRAREFVVQNYYRFGARDSWQKLLERGTGEKLKARYYLDIIDN